MPPFRHRVPRHCHHIRRGCAEAACGSPEGDCEAEGAAFLDGFERV